MLARMMMIKYNNFRVLVRVVAMEISFCKISKIIAIEIDCDAYLVLF